MQNINYTKYKLYTHSVVRVISTSTSESWNCVSITYSTIETHPFSLPSVSC